MAKKSRGPADVNEKDILKLFREAGKPMSRREVASHLGLSKQQRIVRGLLDDLVSHGKLIRIGKGYGLVEKMPLLAGTLEIQRSGVGFVIPEDKRRKDVFISKSNLGGAWHGDKVLAAILPTRRRGKNQEGRISRVVERSQERISVKIVRKLRDALYISHPTDQRLTFNVLLDCTDAEQLPEPGDIALARPGEELERGLWSAELDRLLGSEEDISVQEALVKANYNIPTAFPESVLRETESLPESPVPGDFEGREDLRDLPLVTIDGATARDFDDAVCVRYEGKKARLWVAIADVSHYVPGGSHLDQEALERGNSYYFPQSVEPMFPEKLSNGLCSLVPDKPRLAMVAEILFSAEGRPLESRFYPAVIRSHARLTYSQVRRAVIENDPEEQKRLQEQVPMLKEAERLARVLLQRRRQRGSLDFDLPEPEVLINLRDRTEDIRPKLRHFGHQIIEEFMLAANEAVADFLRDREVYFLYRIHPEPDPEKLNTLFELLRHTDLGPNLPKEWDIKGLQLLLQQAQGTEMEFLVNRLALRSMMQAKYSPVNEGHFGLSSECYTHFTSPIRRYADLVVHRALKGALGNQAATHEPLKRLKSTADQINARERTAMEAEREIVRRLTILFLEGRLGEIFTGVVSSLADFGFWVELKEVMAEGMVRLSSLSDDYYHYFQERYELVGKRTGRTFRLGQEIKVRLAEVNLSRLEVTLELEE
jgi:ribonuclease R